MSEEEIIKYTKNIINATYIEATEQDKDGNIIEQGLVNQQVIQGLLDLYNKEKEKNKELEVKCKMQEYRINVIDERELVSKDKIKEILRKYEYDENYTRQKFYKELKEILEEDNN